MKKEFFLNVHVLYKMLRKLIYKINKDDIFALSSQLAYSLLLSIFPFLMFLFTIIGKSNLNSNDVLSFLDKLLPDNAYYLIESTVIEVVDNAEGSILWISIFLAIWTASSGFRAVLKGLNNAYDTEEKRGFIKRTILAVFCTLALVLVIISTLFLLVFGDLISEYILKVLPIDRIVTIIWDIFRFIFVVLFMIFMCASLYYVSPSKRIKWQDTMPGAIVTTLGWNVVSIGFSFYVNNFSNYSRLYGSLGGVIVLMTWIYLMAFILLLGGEINSLLIEEYN